VTRKVRLPELHKSVCPRLLAKAQTEVKKKMCNKAGMKHVQLQLATSVTLTTQRNATERRGKKIRKCEVTP